MNETLTTRLLSETFEFLETTFRGELALIDHGLAWTIHLVIGLLFLVPVLQAIGRRLGRVFANDAPQTVLVCARCREEVHEHCVRCPSCEHVFPSSFLRACATVAVVLMTIAATATTAAAWRFRRFQFLYLPPTKYLLGCEEIPE